MGDEFHAVLKLVTFQYTRVQNIKYICHQSTNDGKFAQQLQE